MIKRFFGLLFAFFCLSNNAVAKEDPLIIYVALSEVSMAGTVGTSEQLNSLILHHGSNTGALKSALSSRLSRGFLRDIDVYNKENIKFVYNNCNYTNKALECGVKNNHWTLKTFVSIGDKYSIITTKLYDEKGREISRGTQTAWGTIRMVPQWKLTVIKEKGGLMGNKETEIFEQYPPKIEELPPLIRPRHIWQSTILMYSSTRVKK